jgi:hypothetical protein
MKALRFSFKNEARWMLIFSLGIPAIGLLLLLVVILIRRLAI